jgi:small-conductance mechanosensitive channel
MGDRLIVSSRVAFVGLFLLVLLAANVPRVSSSEPGASKAQNAPRIGIAQDMSEGAKREAAKVSEDLEKRAKSLFRREPLGWDVRTAQYLYGVAVSLPSRIPLLTAKIVRESRVLGLLGSLLILFFVMVVLYSLLGQKRAIRWVERKAQPVSRHIPEDYYPYFLSLIKVVASALIPLIMVGLFSLINKMINYQAAWFQLTGRLLWLWAVGALILRLLKETLTRNLFDATTNYGKVIFRYARLILLYGIIGIAAFWAAEVFKVRVDVLELIRFVVSVSVVTVLFLFFLKKDTFLSLLPELSYRGYRWILSFLKNYYYPLLAVSYLAALIWCFGYQRLGRLVLTKIWLTAGSLLAIALIYYSLNERLKRWSQKPQARDEAARFLVRSIKTLLLYATVLSTIIVMLNLLGLLNPIETIMSFPIFQLGDTRVTPWIIIEGVVVLLAFVFASRLLQAYLDYKIYPALGIDPGLGYALNTFFKYLSLAIGFFISINLVGIDLRFLLVFAGAAGIGIGLGLQNMAANVISGFTIIFGGKIRKGDWIEVGQTLGMVTDIYLRATKVRTRDNIEYLIPNSDLISKTIVNYSLSSPLIRIELPVGVSYDTDPQDVERIMVEVAEKEPLVSDYEKPLVRFVEYANSSINFELLVWIDVREVPRRKVRSALYFAIFNEFKKAGIQIPFPQRDIHIRSKAD